MAGPLGACLPARRHHHRIRRNDLPLEVRVPQAPIGFTRAESHAVASLTVENYVKAIFNIGGGDPSRAVTTGAVAGALRVSPGTVTSMLKTLSEDDLASYTPYEGARLTETGRCLALRILRRHRLIEAFLGKSLGLRWDEVHHDAEQMEHVISDFLVERIDEYLQHPQFDPHGDPIPGADGEIPQVAVVPMSQCKPGSRFRLLRVVDQSPEFLRFLTRSGLSLGLEGRVLDSLKEAGTVTIQVAERQITLSLEAAARVLVGNASDGQGLASE